MSEESLRDPYFDLEPKRTRPLSLLDPLDYLTLLWWCFYFPQALRWYVEKFVGEEFRNDQTSLRGRLVLRRLRIQALALAACLPTSVCFTFERLFGAPIYWPHLALGVLLGVVGAIAISPISGSVTFGVSVGVTLGTFSGVFGLIPTLIFVACFLIGSISLRDRIRASIVIGSLLDVIISGIIIGDTSADAPAASSGCFLVSFLAIFPVAFLVVFMIVFIHFAAPVSRFVFVNRGIAWFLGASISKFTFPFWCRPTLLPLPGIHARLQAQFDKNWESGLWATNQLLLYTAQFAPAVAAQNEALARSHARSVLRRIALLAERVVDPQALRYGAASFASELPIEAIMGAPFMAAKLSASFRIDLNLDTPARCGCAGFWLLHDLKPDEAADTFARIRAVPYGTELEQISRALASALEVSQEEFASWRRSTEDLEAFTEPLRKATLKALKELREVAAEVEAAPNAQARVNRSAALGRATATLQRLAQDADLPEPEGKILRTIARQWLPIVIEMGGEAGEAVRREPVKNPYVGYSGLPVEGPTFVGRDDVLRHLQRMWTGSDQNWAAIFLYGHRRMGKTSVLRNLQKKLRPGTVIVQLDMQGAAYVDHTGQLLFEFAKAIHKCCTEMKLDAGEKPSKEEFARFGAGRLRLEALLDQLEPQFQQQTLVLAIDEFEVVEERIEQGKVDPDFLTYLRSLNQRHRFLAIIFAGLHTLEEMGRHYGNAFFGQAEHVRVDYLKKADAMRLITQPSEDFSLEYSPALREELYRRTNGQPYLLQRLCWELVENFNERFLELGPKAPRTLELADLDALDEDEFFLATHYYFDGVWGHRSAAEQQLLRRLAAAPGALSRTDLGDEDQKAIERLLRHDVVLVENDQIDFAAILLREWVARHHPLPE